MSRQIFREEALQRLASPEQLDQLMPLASPRAWIALASLGSLLAFALLWAVFGRIETTVGGEGVLLRPGGVRTVSAPRAGTVAALLVRAGDDVAQGQELVRLAPSQPGGAGESKVVSPERARVLDLAVGQGDEVQPKSPLVVLESTARPPEAVLYLPAGEGYGVRPGMEVRLWLATETDRRAPALHGRVKSASRYPASVSAMMNALQSEAWVGRLVRDGPCLEIVVELVGAPGAKGPRGAPPSPEALSWIYSGTPCRALITVGSLRPIRLVLPVSITGVGF